MRRLFRRTLFYIAISAVAFLVIVPFLWMISTSLKAREATYTVPIRWIPERPSLEAYQAIFTLTNLSFLRATANSIYLSVLLTVLPLLSSAMAAFAFAKIEFAGKRVLFPLFLATMMIPGTVLLIPNYVLLRLLGLLNTYTGLLLPSLCSAFAVFFIRQFMMTVADAYTEAAIIDGASWPRIFLQLMLPLTKPALMTMGLFNFMGAWNNFLWPLIVLSGRERWTLQLALGNMGTQFGNFHHYLMAGALVSLVPIVVVYLISQKYVEQGLAIGGLKA
jgi:multiple sugar transport system permease protein